jgi:hypothetical protein
VKVRCAIAAILFAPSIATAQACSAVLPGGKQVESERYSVGFRTQPERVSVGKHFTVELAVCPKAGAQPPESVRVDAHMPEHRHGMNYKADVVAAPGGRYRAEGLMFHMPGRWEFIFDVRSGGRTDRLTQSLALE